MNSKVVSFIYKKAGFEKAAYNKEINFESCRTVFVMNVDEKYVQGFDFGKLTPSERKFVRTYFKKHQITVPTTKTIKNGNSEIARLIGKSWRKFKKNQMADHISIYSKKDFKIAFKSITNRTDYATKRVQDNKTFKGFKFEVKHMLTPKIKLVNGKDFSDIYFMN